MAEDHAIDGPAKTADSGPQGPHHNAVNSVQHDLNMEDSPAKTLNSSQTVLGKIILLCLRFMRYSCGLGCNYSIINNLDYNS